MATRANLAVGIIGSTAKAVVWVALAALALGAFGGYAFAQEPAAAASDKVLTKDELNTLVGKIALYPDDLVAIVLPASTYPLQVVEAARFLEERKKDASLKPSDKWDDSVVALLNYPDVVKLMNDDLDWTWKLGDAVINQRGEVLDAIQGFRGQAAAAGNLHSDEHQVVQNDDQGEVSIKPADPQVVYVPYYDPQQVVVQQPTPVYSYYPYGYPLYYYPYPYGYPFAAGYFWGVTTAFVIGWHSHYVHVVHCGYPGHPYYGHTYYGGYYARHDASPAMSHGNYVWEPHYRAGGQPFTRSDGRQLAIAHHDPNAGGAPSGYGYHNRGPVSAGNHAPASADFHGNHQAVGPSGARDGMKQIQPIRNDPTTQAAIRNEPTAHGGMKQTQPVRNSPTQASIRDELRAHAPNQSAYTGMGAAGGHAAMPTAPGGRYQAPNPGMAFRGAPQVGAPQFHAPQINPQVHSAPQMNAPQMRSMPMPSSPSMRAMPHEGGASYAYRSPSMSMPQAGHAPAAHQGGAAHGGQGHGGGGGHGSR